MTRLFFVSSPQATERWGGNRLGWQILRACCGSADVLVRSGVASGSGVVKKFGAGDDFELAATGDGREPSEWRLISGTQSTASLSIDLAGVLALGWGAGEKPVDGRMGGG